MYRFRFINVKFSIKQLTESLYYERCFFYISKKKFMFNFKAEIKNIPLIDF